MTIVKNEVKAKQGRKGTHVFTILVLSTIAAIVVLGIVYLAFFSSGAA